ncbi:hypothetical protein K2173_025613 [Erythroxylum novogranatense]|uniref:NPH3 domain-containing protein n=1 Tax=Erythroxylum novogranatense TaxID=1862640 RepID=A0AAV8T9B6_9ROSI|nr:hypothetical protein K2173_025613 [Erythroxylum novogranatense]
MIELSNRDIAQIKKSTISNLTLAVLLSKCRFPDVHFELLGMPFAFNVELLAARSKKMASLLKENHPRNVSDFLKDIRTDTETFELVARFCHGFELNLTTENVIPITCLAHYLEMTENHSPDNLLNRALTFFEQRVLTGWNETIKAYHSVVSNLEQALNLGLIDACIDSIIHKALEEPRLLGEPMKISSCGQNSADEEECFRPSARRRLFVLDWKSEDLTTLPLQLYEPIISEMNQRGLLPEYIAASLCNYAKKWGFYSDSGVESLSLCQRNPRKDVIEAVERLLPRRNGLVPCTLLFEMLRSAVLLGSSSDCIDGYENRIGRQLDQATVKDLLIFSQGYAEEVQYDTESLRRLLKHFYANYSSSDMSGIISVAELIDELLLMVSNDINLNAGAFVSLAQMSTFASSGTDRKSDGIYRAIDIYLDKHRHFTELEREEISKLLDCQKLSPEACEHAMQNGRLPLRLVVQVLFVGQLQLRERITKEVQIIEESMKKDESEEEKEKEPDEDRDEEELRTEMEKMSIKVMELERECHKMKAIVNGCNSHKSKKWKGSMWKEMKRKLGCMNSIHDCKSQVKKKKVHPKYQV